MAKLFKRPGSNKYQCECYVIAADGTRERVLKSTGVIDDGSARAEREAQENAHRIQLRLTAGDKNARGPGKTLQQALKTLTEAAQLAGRSPHTLDNIFYRGTRLAEFFTPSKPLRDIDQQQLRDYAIWSRKVRSAYTVHRELMVLWQALGIVGMDRPPFPDLGDCRTHKPQRVLELDEQRRLLLVTPQRRRINVLSYLQLGLRLSEPWKIVEVEWEARYVLVQGTKRAMDKKRPRRIPIPDELFQLMLERRNEWPVIPRWNIANVDRFIRLSGKRAGICEDLSVNDLRGTYATFMARAGVSPLVLAGILGNSVKMLESVYSQVNLKGDHLHEAVDRGVPRLTAPKPDAAKLRSHGSE